MVVGDAPPATGLGAPEHYFSPDASASFWAKIMNTNYRFSSTQKGVTYFAHVWVEYDQDSDSEIIDAITSVDQDAGEIDSSIEPTWVEAAINGARSSHYYQQTDYPRGAAFG